MKKLLLFVLISVCVMQMRANGEQDLQSPVTQILLAPDSGSKESNNSSTSNAENIKKDLLNGASANMQKNSASGKPTKTERLGRFVSELIYHVPGSVIGGATGAMTANVMLNAHKNAPYVLPAVVLTAGTMGALGASEVVKDLIGENQQVSLLTVFALAFVGNCARK